MHLIGRCRCPDLVYFPVWGRALPKTLLTGRCLHLYINPSTDKELIKCPGSIFLLIFFRVAVLEYHKLSGLKPKCVLTILEARRATARCQADQAPLIAGAGSPSGPLQFAGVVSHPWHSLQQQHFGLSDHMAVSLRVSSPCLSE